MLKSTFQHIPGVGESTEKKLWRRGCVSWERLVESDYSLPSDRYRRIKAGVLESMGRLEALDHRYFRERLGGNLSWRAYETFRDRACFLDIETTGLSPESGLVTCVCVHSNKGTKSYVACRNLNELAGDVAGFSYVVSFNGARFDLPFLERALGLSFDQIHLDLLYPFRRLGFSGGLKAIEKKIGMSRDTDGVTGFDAVRLWKAYKEDYVIEVGGQRVGGEDALDLLVRYNREDTVNLENLATYAFSELKKQSEQHMAP